MLDKAVFRSKIAVYESIAKSKKEEKEKTQPAQGLAKLCRNADYGSFSVFI